MAADLTATDSKVETHFVAQARQAVMASQPHTHRQVATKARSAALIAEERSEVTPLAAPPAWAAFMEAADSMVEAVSTVVEDAGNALSSHDNTTETEK